MSRRVIALLFLTSGRGIVDAGDCRKPLSVPDETANDGC
jgi:hypothetical protein